MTSKKTDKSADTATMGGQETAPITPDNPATLYAPDGRAWDAASPEEVVNLKARGYSETKPTKAQAAAADESAGAE